MFVELTGSPSGASADSNKIEFVEPEATSDRCSGENLGLSLNEEKNEKEGADNGTDSVFRNRF